ncbi:MAG: plastocyanin/azurin family copper-binding protein [Nitriliruptoraceae bacterium]
MPTGARRLATFALALVALAGCGSGEVDDTEEPAAEEPAEGTDGDAGDAGDGDAGDADVDEQEDASTSAPTVVVRDIAFQEPSLTVAAGTTVTWSNEDGVGHTVTSGTPDAPTEVFDEELPSGTEVQITLDEPGTYAYWCRIHPSMTAEVVVEAAT